MLETTPESLPVAVNEDVQSILKSARIEPQAYNEEPSFYSGLDQSINETNPNKRRAQASKPQGQHTPIGQIPVWVCSQADQQKGEQKSAKLQDWAPEL